MDCNLLVCVLLVFQYALITLMESKVCGKITKDCAGNRDKGKASDIFRHILSLCKVHLINTKKKGNETV